MQATGGVRIGVRAVRSQGRGARAPKGGGRLPAFISAGRPACFISILSLTPFARSHLHAPHSQAHQVAAKQTAMSAAADVVGSLSSLQLVRELRGREQENKKSGRRPA